MKIKMPPKKTIVILVISFGLVSYSAYDWIASSKPKTPVVTVVDDAESDIYKQFEEPPQPVSVTPEPEAVKVVEAKPEPEFQNLPPSYHKETVNKLQEHPKPTVKVKPTFELSEQAQTVLNDFDEKYARELKT